MRGNFFQRDSDTKLLATQHPITQEHARTVDSSPNPIGVLPPPSLPFFSFLFDWKGNRVVIVLHSSQSLSLSLSLTLLLVGREGAHLAHSSPYTLGLHLRIRPIFSVEV